MLLGFIFREKDDPSCLSDEAPFSVSSSLLMLRYSRFEQDQMALIEQWLDMGSLGDGETSLAKCLESRSTHHDPISALLPVHVALER